MSDDPEAEGPVAAGNTLGEVQRTAGELVDGLLRDQKYDFDGCQQREDDERVEPADPLFPALGLQQQDIGDPADDCEDQSVNNHKNDARGAQDQNLGR